MNSLQGCFLVASPHLPDPNFFRSVVLMIQHDTNGAFGVILNRPGTKTVSEILRCVGEEPIDECRQLVDVGGPVEGPLVAVHSIKSCTQGEVIPGLFIATRKDLILKIVRAKRPFRVLCGYAGWGPGQLDSELEAGGWLHCPATIDEIFADGDAMWKRITGKIGLGVLEPTLNGRRVPDEPWWN